MRTDPTTAPARATRAGPLACAAALAAILLAGCSGVALRDPAAAISPEVQAGIGQPPRWQADADGARAVREETTRLLAAPLSADDAVRITLMHSPALQALMNEALADSAEAAQSARLANPVFSFGKLVRGEAGARELEIDRALTLSLLDLLSWPQRTVRADAAQQRLRLQLAAQVLEAARQARGTWVRAVSAQQALAYAQQVQDAAEAGGQLARQMEAAGNFGALQRAREQAFVSEALAESTRAAQQARSQRLALVRMLGLDEEQAARLRLPDRLPDLPAALRGEAAFGEDAAQQRLDLRLAQAELEAAGREAGVRNLDSLLAGLELGWSAKSETGQPTQKGWDLAVPLPVFDLGDAGRTAARARYAAAAQRRQQVLVDARTGLSERYAAYRESWQLARHWRDEVLPLRQRVGDEMLRRYNAMLSSVFDLLADARERSAAVQQAIAAEREFWLAEAELRAALAGVPAPHSSTASRD